MDKFIFREKEYKNFKVCCEEFGLHYCNVNHYTKRYNMSRQEALEYCLNPNKTPIYNTKWTFEFRGKTYKSFAECCKEFDLDYKKIYYYTKKYNMSKQEALEYYLSLNSRPYAKKEFEFRGVKYNSFCDCCKKHNVNTSAFFQYCNRNNFSSKQEALEYYLVIRKFEFRGVLYKSLADCCKEYNIDYNSVCRFARRHNLSKQEALEYRIKGKRINNKTISFEFRGRHYDNLMECCREYGINYSTLANYMLNHDISIQDGLERYISVDRSRKNLAFEFRGKTYKSLAECCREFGLKYITVTQYMKNYNKSKQEVLEHYLNPNRTRKFQYPFEFRGKTYKSFLACCEEFGFSPSTIKYHSRTHKITKQEALEYYLNPNNSRKIKFRGKEYKAFKTCCDELGLPYIKVYHYIKTYNKSKQEGLEYYISKKES